MTLTSSVFAALAVIVGSHFLVTQYLKPGLTHHIGLDESATAYLLQDLELLEQANVFPLADRDNNGAGYINPMLGGIDRIGEVAEELPVARSLLRRYPNWRDDVMQLHLLLLDPSLDGISTAWMEDLANYDHLDFSELEEIQERIGFLGNSNSIEKIGLWSISGPQVPITEGFGLPPDLQGLRGCLAQSKLQLHSSAPLGAIPTNAISRSKVCSTRSYRRTLRPS